MAEPRKIQGIKNGRVLTFSDAQEIRSRYCASGVTMGALAVEFGVGIDTVKRIIYWETYRKETASVGRKKY